MCSSDLVPECDDDEYYHEASNTCKQCADNCANCADETGMCEQCIPNTDEGYYSIDLSNRLQCKYTEYYVPEPKPDCTKSEYYNSDDNSCYPCG